MKKSIVSILGLLTILYFLQIFAAPALFPGYYPSTNESTAILFGSIALFSFWGMWKVSDKLCYWLLCDLVYFLGLMLWSNRGAYGIGIVGIALDGNVPTYQWETSIYLVGLIAVLTVLIQLGIWIVVRTARWVIRICRNRKNND